MNKEKLKEFIAFLKDKTVLKSEEFLEKDFYISLLLNRIVDEGYALKGGTCLSKVYLNYHRISEDIDLTFIDQDIFKRKSTKQIKKICSEKIKLFGELLENTAKEYGFEFKLQKSNKRYIELGSNNKLVTFKVWYYSVLTGAESFIKIQITFLEIIKYAITEKTVLPLINADIFSKTDRLYFSDYINAYKPLKCPAYDLREIASEKIRALLTRRGIKARDIADLYFIGKRHEIGVDALKDICIEKVDFAIRNYEKYNRNISAKVELSGKDIILEDAEHLMLVGIDRKDFDVFTEKLFAFLREVKAEILLE